MRLNVELTREMYDEMTAHAARSKRSLSDIVRTLVEEWNRTQRAEVRDQEAFARGEAEKGVVLG